jgi:hypothetical protein
VKASALLDRLDRVKQTGAGRWLARCPNHEDRSPSLSIRELDDGRVLLHDFGGCSTGDVLAALGLQMGDLFEKPLGDLAPSHSRVPAVDLLKLADHEILVAALILDDVVAHRRINPDQLSRLTQAAAKIGRLRDHGSA